MKLHLLLLLSLAASAAVAGERASANYAIVSDTADAGGRRAGSANYANDGSAGWVVGLSAVAAPAETVKHGYLGQLFDITGLVVNAAAPDVNETATLQLGAWQLLDDATYLGLNASLVSWSVVAGPIASISAAGLATAGSVFQNTSVSIQGVFGGFTGTLSFSVLDAIADNFGTYAGDGIGDDWQVQYFGQDNPLAAPGLDPDGDGQTNAFEFAAGLTPTDPASTFHLRIERVPGQPGQKRIVFSPRLADRIYTVKAKPGLLGGTYTTLESSSFTDDAGERTVTDLSASGAAKFYTVEVTKP